LGSFKDDVVEQLRSFTSDVPTPSPGRCLIKLGPEPEARAGPPLGRGSDLKRRPRCEAESLCSSSWPS
jgi:hypothetical protein